MRKLIASLTAFCCILAAGAWSSAAEDLAKLTKDLGSGQAAVRAAAADAIAKWGPEARPAVGALIGALASDDANLRWRAARTLGVIGPAAADAVPALTKAIGDKNARVRAYAAFALGRIGKASIPAAKNLVRLAFDKDALVRRAAVQAVLRIQPPIEVTLPVALKLLNEGDPETIAAALQTMAEAGEKAVPRLRECLKTDAGCYFACLVLADIGPAAKAAVPDLIKLLDHTDPEVRMQALVALGAIGPAARAAAPKAAELLRTDKVKAVRYAAAYALGAFGDKETARNVLSQAARSDDAFLRVVSAWGLASLFPDDVKLQARSAKEIAKGLESDDKNVRLAAARALAASKAPSEIVAPALVKALEKADDDIVANAVSALASLGAKAVPRVLRGLDNEKLRWYAVEVLERIGPDAAPAVPKLADLLVNDPDDDFRREVEFALGAIGPGAAPATPALIKALSDDNPEVRRSACYVLGKIGPDAAQAVPVLKKCLGGEDSFLRLASAWALAHIRPGDREIAKLATPLLIEGLRDERPEVRAEAARALGALGPPAESAAPSLQKALNDANEDVRRAAAEALKKVQP